MHVEVWERESWNMVLYSYYNGTGRKVQYQIVRIQNADAKDVYTLSGWSKVNVMYFGLKVYGKFILKLLISNLLCALIE